MGSPLRIAKHWRFKLWGIPMPATVPPRLGERSSYADMLKWIARQYGEGTEAA